MDGRSHNTEPPLWALGQGPRAPAVPSEAGEGPQGNEWGPWGHSSLGMVALCHPAWTYSDVLSSVMSSLTFAA